MAIEFAYDSARNRLVIGGKFTVLHVAEAMAQLKDLPGADLDLADVTEIDGAGLQLLLVAQRDVGMRMVAVSDAVANVVALAGRVEMTETLA